MVKAFMLIEPGPVVLVTTNDGEILNYRSLMENKLPEGV